MSSNLIYKIASLIQQLYSPGQHSDQITSIQQQLQTFQKQPDANILANQLLHHDDQNVQYFGALTYTVYINTHELKSDNQIADVIANEIINACNRSLNLLVIKKLLSNLGKIYAKTLYCPLDLILEKVSQSGQNEEFVLEFGLLSSQIIAEELNRSDESFSKEKHEIIIQSMFKNTSRTVLDTTLNFLNQPKVEQLWFSCLQAWSFYVSKAEYDSSVGVDLNEYYDIVIELLSSKNDSNSLALLIDIYDTNPALLNYSNKMKLDNLIFSDWCTKFIQFFADDKDEISKLSKFLALFLDSDMIYLASKMIDPSFDDKFQYLLYLTSQPGCPITDESFSVDLLDFWISFTEAVVNDTESIHLLLKNDQTKINALNDKTYDYFLNLSQIYWQKCHIIENITDYEDEFISFRRDIGELFESLYSILKSNIFKNLTTSIITSISNEQPCSETQLKDIETSLYLLTCISSIFTENNLSAVLINELNLLFNSQLINMAITISNSDTSFTTQYFTKILIRFLSEITWFYQNPSGEPFINGVLIFLFNQLNNKSYQEQSSKAILLITDLCRGKLMEVLNDFEAAANSMIVSRYEVPTTVRSRIIRSYASILETVTEFDLKAEKISNFLQVIYVESLNAFNSININLKDDEILKKIDEFLLSLVSSLVGLSKGLQIPEDWEDYYDGKKDLMNQTYQYWKFEDEKKFKVHEKCLQLVSLYTFPNKFITDLKVNKNLDTKILEQVCLFFKSGLTEPLPGPFVIEYNKILDYIIICSQYCQEMNFQSSNDLPIIHIIELYGILVKSNYTSATIYKLTNLNLSLNDLKIDLIIDEILFKQFDKVITEPDIMSSLFTLFSNILSTYPSVLIQNIRIVDLINVAIEQLFTNSHERFVIISLSKFWTNLLYLRKGKIEDINYVKNILIDQDFGHRLVYALMKGLISTSRSNLEFYTDIIRALTSKYNNNLSNWINSSFKQINLDKSRDKKKIIECQDIRIFSKKLILTRGNRAANKIVKDFWFLATGLVDYGNI